MLDAETKRRIDSCRDILVGKVPDPKSQVEQITIALIYKFMDDMDAEAEELGGSRSFFTGDYAKYGWAKLMRSGLGGHETLNLYAEAIAKMPENPGIPALFRDIFKNAYLPYRDPETLRSFLKEIDVFSYDHSEKLGDAFEYLLSVLGSQGDAGQFRTPRHIIDFMVEVMNPQKSESLLDPACGTAGFLISAWKHILKCNTKVRTGDQLTPDERTNLAANIHGYDISPDMVRLSLVNLYLHGFSDPHVVEYDTLTSDEKWNETADVILANPPFMSPKGGIKPHKRFSILASRSEVLFVDYIAEHLSPNGRAAIVVPEGIIFQNQTAYKSLRKLLVEKYLVAVISLPAGVFNPYAGVKTSILILDKRLAKTSDSIAYFKVENDGFGLGAQRRAFDKNDLPQIKVELDAYLQALRSQHPTADLQLTRGLIVTKERIATNGDYNISGERYRDGAVQSTHFPWMTVGSLVETITPPSKIQKTAFGVAGRFPIIDQSQDAIAGWTDDEATLVHPAKPLVIFGDHTCAVKLVETPFAQGADGIKILQTIDTLDPRFLFHVLRARPLETDGYQRHYSKLKEHKIPLPPLEVQKEIVVEIEGYKKVINGARAVLDHYRPHISIHPDWPMVELGKIARLINGRAYKQEELLTEGPTPVLRVGNFFSNRGWYYSDLELDEDKYCNEGDLLYAWSASFGPRIWEGPRAIYHYHIWKIETTDAIDKRFLLHLLAADSERIKSEGNGIAMVHATKGGMEQRKFPVPPLATQQSIVAEIEAEQALVAANRELIARFEKKIQVTLARVWGEVE
jgi:type I restriction enzyme M protein